MAQKHKILVEYLFLDLASCDRCIGTGDILDEVMKVITPALEIAGYDVEYRKIEIQTEEMARAYQFLSSPTIRVNGADVCQSVEENSCGCCSEISGTDVDCRVFEYDGQISEIPPREMLAQAILKAAFSEARAIPDACGRCAYDLPENLKTFFEGKSTINKSRCSCA